ncbi:MAG TPA: sigma-70 family RNA polymerase sigma factor [Pseudobdellovibrionaceae bacterium]|nr:sigma-70 family RNA polymerase sigma factor [Pseudobdellovibrionaceae bacterium]
MSDRERNLIMVEKEHRPRLLAMIRRRLRDQIESEDVYQEVFEEFIETYDIGTAIESVGAWLVRVAQNKIVDRFRRRKTREDSRARIERDGADLSAARPDEEFSRKVIRQEIAEALSLLPPEQSEVFVMHELEGKSFEEIAERTGVGLNTLLSRKRYAVLSLRDYLKEIYDELE